MREDAEEAVKLRPMTWGRWVEVISGVLLPTMVFGLYLLYGLIFSLGSGDLLGALMALVGLGVLLSLWLLVFLGSESISRNPIPRWFIIVILLLGFVVALFYTKSSLISEWKAVFNLMSSSHHNPLVDPVRFGSVLMAMDFRFNTAALSGVMVVGARHLAQLLKGAK